MSNDRLSATVRIWEPILPVDRGERYELPLESLFDETGRGQMTGAGTQLTDTKEIDFVELELDLDDDDDVIDDVLRVLEEHGAPRHSRLVLRSDEEEWELTFGVTEGIAIRLDRLPPEGDFDRLIERLVEALGTDADYRGAHVRHDRELTFYFYGLDAETLWKTLAPLVGASDLCRGARVVLRCGHPDGEPRQVTLP